MKMDSMYLDIADHYNDPWYGSEDDDRDILFPKTIRQENLHDFCVGHAVRHSAPYEQVMHDSGWYYHHRPEFSDECRRCDVSKKHQAMLDLKAEVQKALAKLYIESDAEYDVEYWSMIVDQIEKNPARYYKSSLDSAKRSRDIAVSSLSRKLEIEEKRWQKEREHSKQIERRNKLIEVGAGQLVKAFAIDLANAIWYSSDTTRTNQDQILSKFPIYSDPVPGTLAYDICQSDGNTIRQVYEILYEFRTEEAPDDIEDYHGRQAVLYRNGICTISHDLHVVLELLKSMLPGSDIAFYDEEHNVMYPYKDTPIKDALQFTTKRILKTRKSYTVFLCEHGINVDREVSKIMEVLRDYYVTTDYDKFIRFAKKLATSFFNKNRNEIADLFLENDLYPAHCELKSMVEDSLEDDIKGYLLDYPLRH